MTYRNGNGDTLSKTEVLAAATAQPAPETEYVFNSPVYETYSLNGESGKNFESGKRLLFRTGQRVKQSEIDRLFAAASVSTVSPASGLAAGNTLVTITGTNLEGVETVTFGGAQATEVKVKSKTQVTCKTPAHAAGQVNVVVGDDSGNVTKTNAYTYS